jgi:pimeloyl-ACP methyl ester carboxylesterase
MGCGTDTAGPAKSEPIAPCFYADARCWEQLSLGSNLLLPLYRTHPIQGSDTTVVRAIIIVHGAGRNPADYFRIMVETVFLERLELNTLVIAPHFQTGSDGPDPAELTWTSGGWKRGDQSLERTGAAGTLSSYEAVDRIIQFLADTLRYPNLETVVVTGHSAGGQYTHRFAATSPAGELIHHLRFRYIVANPSTYLYIREERPSSSGAGFEVPDREACHNYNTWHYGFENRNRYALRLTEEQTRERLLGRDVIYLVGTADTGDASLDMSCGAMLQGRHRYVRGLNLFAFLNTFYPDHPHRLFEIEGVAHSSSGMYKSEIGREMLFQW